MKPILILALVAALVVGTAHGLETATAITVIGDGHMTAMYDLPDATMRATGNGNISYVSEGYITSNTTSLGSEFIVDGPGGRNTYAMSMLPDRYGVEHSVEARAFNQLRGAGYTEIGSETGEQYFTSVYDITSIGGHGEEFIGRGEDGKLRDQERIYFGDLTGYQLGKYHINSSVFEDCIDVPAGEIDWLPCLGIEEDNPSLFYDSSISVKEEDLENCETCSM